MALSRVHHPVLTLGHGRRAGVWMQGCSIGCAGCVSRDTWVAGKEHEVDVEDVLAWVHEHRTDLDGVTVTGGEPFDQPRALAALLEGLTVMRRKLPQPVDVLCYSGYPLSRLERRHPELLARADAVVSGPFVRARAEALPLRGSSNQRVTALTALGRDRYAGTETDDPAGPRQPRLQVAASPGTLWYIGIPAPGDMERLDAMMRDRGVRQQRVSWTA